QGTARTEWQQFRLQVAAPAELFAKSADDIDDRAEQQPDGQLDDQQLFGAQAAFAGSGECSELVAEPARKEGEIGNRSNGDQYRRQQPGDKPPAPAGSEFRV